MRDCLNLIGQTRWSLDPNPSVSPRQPTNLGQRTFLQLETEAPCLEYARSLTLNDLRDPSLRLFLFKYWICVGRKTLSSEKECTFQREVIMLQNPSSVPVFREAMEKPRFKNSSIPIINGNGNGILEHSPPPKLERVTEGSIPISLIADRVIRRSYGEFLNLAET